MKLIFKPEQTHGYYPETHKKDEAQSKGFGKKTLYKNLYSSHHKKLYQ